MGKRWIAALAALFVLTGLFAACGDDDDDVAADDTEEAVDDLTDSEDDGSEEQAEVDDAKAAFCADLNEGSDGSEAVEDVQAQVDVAVAAQTATETQEQFDALHLFVDFGSYVVDTDDGDGVVSDEETSAALAEFPTLEDAAAELSTWCEA